MTHRHTVTICDMEYTLVGEESAEHVDRIATMVDEKMRAVLETPGLTVLDAAVLTAVNLAEENLKSTDRAEHLRKQLTEYVDQATQLNEEVTRLRRKVKQDGK